MFRWIKKIIGCSNQPTEIKKKSVIDRRIEKELDKLEKYVVEMDNLLVELRANPALKDNPRIVIAILDLENNIIRHRREIKELRELYQGAC